jgi:hypothetical protein
MYVLDSDILSLVQAGDHRRDTWSRRSPEAPLRSFRPPNQSPADFDRTTTLARNHSMPNAVIRPKTNQVASFVLATCFRGKSNLSREPYCTLQFPFNPFVTR